MIRRKGNLKRNSGQMIANAVSASCRSLFEPLESRQLFSLSISTTVDVAATNLPVSGYLAQGTSAYDSAKLTASPFVPTGTFTYNFYNTATPVYGTTTPVSSQTVALTGGGVPNSAATAGLLGGNYAFIGVYSGDSNYATAVGSIETLAVTHLLGIPYANVFPDVESGGNGGVTYIPTTATTSPGLFTANSSNISLVTSPTVVDSIVPDSANSVGSSVTITVSNLGNLLAGGGGSADITVQGEVLDQSNNPIANGVLLTGTIEAFGYEFDNARNVNSSGAQFDFRFHATGGLLDTMPGYFIGSDIGMNFNAQTTSGAFSANPFANGFTLINPKAYVVPVTPWTVNTIVKDAGGGLGNLGEKVIDTATVGGSYTPGGTLVYNFYNTATPTYGTTTPVSTQTVTLSGGSVPDSAPSVSLPAGSYSYIAAYFESGNNQILPPALGPVEPFTINQASSSVSTTIDNTATNLPVSGSQALGTSVYDTATVTGAPFTPTGTVTYNYYNTATPVYGTTTPVGTQTVTLNADGTVPNSSATGALAAGGNAFIAVYSGDSNYTGYTGAVEPLSISQGSSSVSTTITDSGGGVVTGALGESVVDTATVTGTPFTPTGTVTYNFYNTASPTYGTTTPSGTQTVTLNADGSVPNSAATSALAAGGNAFIAVYSGDSNYTGNVGSVEPITISQSSSSVSTTITDSGGGVVTSALGETVVDTATVTGTPFTPTGTVTYNFYNTASPTYGTTTPSGTQTVTLNADGSVPNSAATSALAAGGNAFIAVYSGDSNYTGYTGAVEPVTIKTASSSVTTMIQDSGGGPVTGALGEQVYDTAKVYGTPFTPTGTVTYYFYTTSTPVYGTTSPMSTQTVTIGSGGGVKTITIGGAAGPNSSTTLALPVGSYAYIATYSGDSNYSSSVGAIEPLSIAKASSSVSTTIEDSGGGPVTSALGESVIDTATVTGTPFTPTGTVTYYFYNTSTPVYGTTTAASMQTVTLNANGSVPNSSATGALAAGSNAFIAVYSGDSNYACNVGAVEPLSINMASSSVSTTILDSTGIAVTDALGETVYDTATVTGVSGIMPTGTVTYNFYTTKTPVYGTTTPVAQTVTLSGGAVPNSNTSAALGAGCYSYIAVYSGDSNYNGSTGAIEPLTIGKAASSVSTTIYDSTSANVTNTLGEQVYDTAGVSGAPGVTPTGTVTYYFYSTSTPVYGTTVATGNQTVTLTGGNVPNSATTAALTAGSDAYIAVYSGDSNYAGSTGAVEPLTINKASSSVSTTILDCSGGSVTDALGEKVYDTATVTGVPFTPTGTVTYYFYNTSTPVYGTTTPTSTQTVTLSSGNVPNSATTAALTAGSDAYIAVYSGDSNYAGATGSIEPVAINKATPSVATTIKDSGGGAITQSIGEKVYDTSVLTGTAGVTPSGTVTYYFYNTNAPVYGTTTPSTTQTVTISAGTIPNSATTAALAAGSDAYIAVYSGDTNYLSAIGAPETLTIGKHAATVCTTIKDSCGCTLNDNLGEKVYDTTTVTGVSGTTATGTVTYYFYNTSSPVYGVTTPASTQTVTLSSGGVPNSATTAALAAGGYAYIAVYSGDTNYSSAIGAVEPLTINKACSSVSTCIVDSGGGSCNNELNEKVYDTAKVAASPLTATGTVTYYFYNTSSPVYGKTTPLSTQTVTLSSGSAPNSALTSTLAAGSYAYIAVYSGDGNYNGSIGSIEALKITTNCISGKVCKDCCGSGYNCNEQGLSGCTVQLWENGTCIQSCCTASDGSYCFSNLGAGCFTVKEVCGSGWTQTCGNNGFTCTGTAGQCFNTCDFSNFHDCSISGSTYQCSNNNWCGNQSSVGGCTVQLWQNGACVATCTSASNGSYCFNNVGPGCYTVKQVTKSNCYLSTGSCGYTWNTCDGQSYSNCNFSNW